MNIRYFSLIVLLIMSFLAPVQAQTYDKMWKDLEVLEGKDLPKSVVSEAMKIYDKAKAEQNVPQMMKAYLTAMQYRALLTPDSLSVDMKGLEQWASRTTNIEDKSVLYSILGEMTMRNDVKQGFNYLRLSLFILMDRMIWNLSIPELQTILLYQLMHVVRQWEEPEWLSREAIMLFSIMGLPHCWIIPAKEGLLIPILPGCAIMNPDSHYIVWVVFIS